MIEKSRLEELIEQEESAWYIKNNKVKQGWFVKNGKYFGFRDENHISVNAKEYYETKEEAEWQIEFGCIERTERLELPTWEEFNSKYCEVKFYTYKHQYTLFNSAVKIRIINENKVIFEEDFSKDNYLKVCRKCKELFLGDNE